MRPWWHRRIFLGSMVSAGTMITAGGGLQAQPPQPPGAPVRIVSPLPVPTTVSGTVDVNVVSGVVDVNVVNAQSPVNYSFSCSTAFVGCGPALPYQVPAGQRLVVEYAGVHGVSVPAGDAVTLEIRTSADGVLASFWVTPPPVSPGGRSASSQTVKLYADPGTYVSMMAQRASGLGGSESTNYSMTFSGHLVPIE